MVVKSGLTYPAQSNHLSVLIVKHSAIALFHNPTEIAQGVVLLLCAATEGLGIGQA